MTRVSRRKRRQKVVPAEMGHVQLLEGLSPAEECQAAEVKVEAATKRLGRARFGSKGYAKAQRAVDRAVAARDSACVIRWK